MARRQDLHPRVAREALLGLVLLASCSMYNRTGPDVTCQDLKSGAVNACADGIIASCKDGSRVVYEVCTEKQGNVEPKDLCDAAWQIPGSYSCTSRGPGSGGSAGMAGQGGSSGAGGFSGQGGTIGEGGATGQGGAAGSTNACSKDCLGGACIDGACQPVELGGMLGAGEKQSCSLALDATHVYYGGSYFELARVPKQGGNPVSLSKKAAAGTARIVVDNERVYWTGFGTLGAALKAGGSDVELAQVGGFMLSLSQDAQYLYWGGDGLFQVNKATNQQLSLAELGGNRVLDLVSSSGELFWCQYTDSSNSRVIRSTTPGSQTINTLVTEPDGINRCRIAVDATHVYWTTKALVRKMPRAGGAVETIATATANMSSTEYALAMDADELFFCNGYSLYRVSKSGGAITKMFTLQYTSCRDIAVDQTAVYWCDAAAVRRVAK